MYVYMTVTAVLFVIIIEVAVSVDIIRIGSEITAVQMVLFYLHS
jgi:hypothetical protein